MYIQPLQAVESPGCYHVGGDVTIHPSATIAPGALIRAEPNCMIAIGAAACVGMGVVLHACEGNIEIESGVSLGAAVLIVGRAAIGANASIGSSTTLRNCVVEAGAIVPAASLLGELDKPSSAPAASREAGTSNDSDGLDTTGDLHTGGTPSPDDAGTAQNGQLPGILATPADISSGGVSHPSAVEAIGGPITSNGAGTSKGAAIGNSDRSLQPISRSSDSPENFPGDDDPQPGNGLLNGRAPSQDDNLTQNGVPPSLAGSTTQANSRPLASGPPVEGSTSGYETSNGHAQEPALSQQSLLAPKPAAPKPSPAFGKSQVNRLMKSLFPHSQAYTSPTPNENAPQPAALPDADATEGVTSDSTL
ncbi:MAG: hypothetical protein AAF268_06540 [Cyanobacteria bacterium P01_A01_bin.3]